MTHPDEDTAEYPPDALEHAALQHAAPQVASVREGRHIVEPDAGHLPPVGDDLWTQLEEMRELFRVGRDPFNDPMHRHLSPGVKTLYQRIRRAVKERLDDDELFDLYAEVMSYLLRRDL